MLEAAGIREEMFDPDRLLATHVPGEVKMGRRTLPAPDPALISNGSLRRKFNACNESASVIRLFIRNATSRWANAAGGRQIDSNEP